MLNALPGSLSPTVPMTLATELLTGLELDQEVIRKVIERANIAPELFQESGARISIEQFSRFYRQLAILLDDETPGFFLAPCVKAA